MSVCHVLQCEDPAEAVRSRSEFLDVSGFFMRPLFNVVGWSRDPPTGCGPMACRE